MLKRYQILLEDWMADHYKLIADKYDVSFSEMVRMALCVDILSATRVTFPKYKPKIDDKKMEEAVKRGDIIDTIGAEKFHSFLSNIYFETRKATELWTKKGKVSGT